MADLPIGAARIPIGASLKQLREHLGMTQTELGAKLGWSHQRISYLERGKFYPTLPTLFLIAEITGVDASKIIRNVERRKKSLLLHE